MSFNIEKVAVEGTGTDVLSFDNEKIIYDKLSKNITLMESKRKVTLKLKRSVSSNEVRRMERMPGLFRGSPMSMLYNVLTDTLTSSV